MLSILLALVALAYVNFNRLAEVNRRNIHSYHVLEETHGVLASLINMESGARGFVLTDDEQFLEPFLRGRTEFFRHLNAALELTGDNPEQQQRFRRIRTQQERWMRLYEPVLAARGSSANNAEAIIKATIGARQRKEIMDSMRVIVAAIEETERVSLRRRSQEEAGRQYWTKVTLMGGGAFAVLLSIALATLLARSARRLSAVNTRLKEEAAERLRAEQSAQRLAAIVESSEDAIYAQTLDGTIASWNKGAEKLYGYSAAEAVERSVAFLVPAHCADELPQLLAQLRRGEYIESYETQRLRRDGQCIDVSLTISPIKDASGVVTGASAIARDITERKRAEDALRESEERYALAARGANDGLWDWNLKTNEIYFSPRWKAMLGHEDHEIGSSADEWFSRIHSEDVERVRAELAEHLEGASPDFESEHRMRRSDGVYCWVHSRGLALRAASGSAYRIAGSQTDITERKVAEHQLLHDVYHDALTGIPNRAQFMNRLEQMLQTAKRRNDYVFAVLFLDLDGFKAVNDTHGHATGDELLIVVARRLKAALRGSGGSERNAHPDLAARLAGDEFTLLLDNIKGVNDAIAVAERVRCELETPFMLGSHEVRISVSIGIALSTTGYRESGNILRHADAAMYEAKKQGKARYVILDNRVTDQPAPAQSGLAEEERARAMQAIASLN